MRASYALAAEDFQWLNVCRRQGGIEMKSIVLAALLGSLLSGALAGVTYAQAVPASSKDPDSTQAGPPPKPRESPIYWGGSITLSFGNPTHVGISPLVGFKLTPKMSIGTELTYEYLKYDGAREGSNNYGGSAFTRYRILPQFYGHAEYRAISYEILTSPTTSYRETVPFLLVGGGLSQLVAPRTYAYAEVLFDLLNDDLSPYDSGDPIISFGVGVGF